MTANMFITLFVLLSTISSLLTEAVKKGFQNISSNLIALIDGLVVGGGGAVAAYILLGIPFTPTAIVAIVAMAFFIAIGSMVGYDKVTQLLNQIEEKKDEISR